MSSVLPASNAASIIPNARVSGDLSESTAASSQDRFLKLLVTQMRNQDPLNPMDNAQFTTQLAQISTVSGLEKLNTSLSGMADRMAASSSLQNANLIGRGVVFPGDRARFDGTSPVPVGLELVGPAERVNLSIADSNGNVVRTFALGALPQGMSTFSWDGRSDASSPVPAGTYTLRVEAASKDGPVAASTLLGGVVDSVSVAGGSSRLNLRGLGAIDIAQVRRID